MAEDRGAEVVHHALADLVREQGLQDPQRARGDRDRDDSGGVERERAVVVAEDRLQDVLEQERRHDAERRGEDDQRQQARKTHLVRAEERPDPAQVRPAHLGIGRALGWPVV